MASPVFTVPKAFPGYGLAFAETSGFEAATPPWEDNLQIQA